MNFFATGNDSFKAGLDLKVMSPIGSHCANFSDKGQTLQQSYSIAAEVFKRGGGKIISCSSVLRLK